ncbi:MAG TPA: polysaccharide biosynthesis/export family protein [Longimicrobiales bacterium]
MQRSIQCLAGTLAAAALTVAGAAGCASHATMTTPVEPEPIVLFPGDMVRLQIWRGDHMNGDYLVNSDGTAVLPLIGPWPVAGKSADSLKAELLAEYARYMRTPSIEVLPLRRVNILGAVQKGGLYPIDPTMTLADALALAGGATPQGDPNKVDLIRGGRRIRAELSQDTRITELPIRSGDQLFVPERSWISRNAGVVGAIISASASLAVALLSFYRDRK